MLLYIIGILILYYLWSQRRYYILHWKLSGPIGLPFLGSVLDIRDSGRLSGFFQKVKQNYDSPSVVWLASHCCLVVSDPVSLEVVFNSHHCIDKSFTYTFLRDFMGDGLFTSKREKWYVRRKMLAPAFHKKILTNFMTIFNEKTDEFLSTVRTNLEKEDFKLQTPLRELSLDVACNTTLGNPLLSSTGKILTSYLIVMHLVIERIFKPWLYNLTIYKWTKRFKNCIRATNTINVFVEKMINDRIESRKLIKIENNASNEIGGNTTFLIDQLLDNVDPNGLTLRDVRDEANVLMAAAFETTSNVLHLIVMCLAMHSEYQEKLFEELCQVFPNPDFDATEADLKKLIYCEMVMNETMRLLAPVPILGRVTTADIQLNNSVTVPCGTEILIDIFNMQRSSQYWGPKSQTFYPDHFSSDNLKNVHPYAFTPFARGTRMCLGFIYTMKFMKVALAKLFRKYKITTDWQLKDISIKCDVSLQLNQYPPYKIEKRTI